MEPHKAREVDDRHVQDVDCVRVWRELGEERRAEEHRRARCGRAAEREEEEAERHVAEEVDDRRADRYEAHDRHQRRARVTAEAQPAALLGVELDVEARLRHNESRARTHCLFKAVCPLYIAVSPIGRRARDGVLLFVFMLAVRFFFKERRRRGGIEARLADEHAHVELW